jgi:biofilm protein TabA
MIVDILDNIELYKNISPDIFEGLKFLKNVKSEIEIGTYLINENVKAIVSEYETVELFKKGYEAHKNVIDIQYPITGLERVKWSPISQMDINIPYDSVNDVAYFKNPINDSVHVDIGDGIFVIMFPEDGHGPQHFVTVPEFIKKITIKISI